MQSPLLRLVISVAFVVGSGLANAQAPTSLSCKREEAEPFLPLAGR